MNKIRKIILISTTLFALLTVYQVKTYLQLLSNATLNLRVLLKGKIFGSPIYVQPFSPIASCASTNSATSIKR